MRGLSLTFSALIAGLFLANPTTRADDAKVPDSKYYPLSVGTEWKYVIKTPNGDKEITSKIVKFEMFEGVMCALQETSVDGTSAGREHLRGDDKGMKRYSYNGVALKPPVEFIKLPVKKGDKWSGESEVGGQKVTFTFEIAATDEKVKVPAGEYEAIAVKTTFSAGGAPAQQNITLYYAPGVGQVKTVITVNGTTIPVELKEFKKGK
jgi:hypothetical protein